MKLYILLSDQNYASAKYFISKDVAQAVLAKKKSELKPGITNITEDTLDTLSYHFSWQKTGMSWKIIEKDIIEKV